MSPRESAARIMRAADRIVFAPASQSIALHFHYGDASNLAVHLHLGTQTGARPDSQSAARGLKHPPSGGSR